MRQATLDQGWHGGDHVTCSCGARDVTVWDYPPAYRAGRQTRPRVRLTRCGACGERVRYCEGLREVLKETTSIEEER